MARQHQNDTAIMAGRHDPDGPRRQHHIIDGKESFGDWEWPFFQRRIVGFFDVASCPRDAVSI